MAAGMAEGDAHMEELLDQGLGMEETAHGLLRRPSLKGGYHCDSLLAPDTDFMTDDRSSAASGMDVADRLTYLEQRMQMQEDEIQLLKMALADVLKRLNISEEHQAAAAAGRRPSGGKMRPVSLALPSRPPMVTSSAASLKKSSTLPSSSTARNYSPTPPRSSVKSPPGSVKDSPCKTSKSRPASAAAACKKPSESSKSKEAAVSVGTRRVTHCKVTMQIYLSPLKERLGLLRLGNLRAVPANSGPVAAPSNPKGRQQAIVEENNAVLHPEPAENHHQPDHGTGNIQLQEPHQIPSQYFQICY